MEKSQKRWNILIIFMLLIVMILAFISVLNRKSTDNQNVISMTGSAEVKVKPDTFLLSYSIKNTDLDIRKASERTTNQSNEMLDKLKDLGIESKNIKTESMDTSEKYQSDEDKKLNKPKQYNADETTKVTIKENEQLLNKTIDLIKNSGHDSITLNSVDSTVTDNNSGLQELTDRAFQNAKNKAENFARVGDFKLNKVVGVTEKGADYSASPRVMKMAMPAAENDSATPETSYQIGEQEVSMSVTVTWEIG